MLWLEELRSAGELSGRWSSKCRLIRADAFAGPSGMQPAPSPCGSPTAIANSVNARLDQRTWSNPSSTKHALRSFRENLRLTLTSRKEAESGSLLISARAAVQSCFWTLKRFPEIFGVYGGTFDDPNWFDRTPQTSRHIFLNSAQRSTVIPAGFSAFREHAMLNDGTPVRPQSLSSPAYNWGKFANAL